jgi:hypothetical protein
MSSGSGRERARHPGAESSPREGGQDMRQRAAQRPAIRASGDQHGSAQARRRGQEPQPRLSSPTQAPSPNISAMGCWSTSATHRHTTMTSSGRCGRGWGCSTLWSGCIHAWHGIRAPDWPSAWKLHMGLRVRPAAGALCRTPTLETPIPPLLSWGTAATVARGRCVRGVERVGL